ncbi:biliverdin-producing heme oxygenase [Sphingosinicella rhizophila]|uniref:Biliverdin-producing heme oxygenase n=1 Tax=Sphingosinicella rhizophila TaxID=3050082 RepID=A0ABU3Q8P7_9SPHN|nr:biliverdin-producing heme oxygenase [Sphingosinicella sp. GR2756]MDT9599774.1 biliverdin-producing heme oxygenase [Sphingosinicella sp. GR2756]
MSVRAALRGGTARHHERVDALFGGFDLRDPGEYGRFLIAQAEAFLPIEAAIDAHDIAHLVADWPSRRRGDRLRQDLRELGLPLAMPMAEMTFTDDASALGALYVIEGSRLGGALLKRNLPADLPQNFLGTKGRPGSWPKLLEILDEYLYGTVRIGLALQAARAAFACFEAAGRRHLGAEPA